MRGILLAPCRGMIHTISSILLVPTLLVLLLFVAITVVELGGLVAEILLERRRMRINVPELLDAFQGKDAEGIRDAIAKSRLLRSHKIVLSELTRHSRLPANSLQALARRLLSEIESYYVRVTIVTDIVARLGPMFGLMATLIPLGPGLIALSQGDTRTLAESLLTAFDATVTGLAAASICYAISRLRKRWYEDYLTSLEALMDAILEVLVGGPQAEEKKVLNR